MTHEEIQKLYNDCPHTKILDVEMRNIKQDLDEIKISINDLKNLIEKVIEDDNSRDKILSSLQAQVRIQWFVIGGAVIGVIGALIRLFIR